MSGPPAPDALELAALLCSRVCHDLISPVGAIVNGLEVMEDDPDEETKAFALELIKKSTANASARLQFCRLAFGAAGSAAAQIDLGDAETVARGFLEDGKTKITWSVPRLLLPKNRVKLLLNLLIIAGQAIPRGGMLSVQPDGTAETMGFRIVATGPNSRVPAAAAAILDGSNDHAVDAHAVQPYYTALLAKSSGLTVTIAPEGETIVLSALAQPAPLPEPAAP
ncbi:MAG TPA: histidine phosphotransferase family protein [Xanthobacteraceae bacterium]|jgi:histidine phosphotransferase ChpT